MMIAKIKEQKNGRGKVVEFYREEILRILMNDYGYRYAKVGKKKYFLKLKDNTYKVVRIDHIRREFANHMKDKFESLEIDGKIECNDFINEYYRQDPIKLDLSHEILSEDFLLTEKEEHDLKLKLDDDYSFKYRKKEILSFLKNEDFTEVIEIKTLSKYYTLFYKKTEKNKFLTFKVTEHKHAKQITVEFGKIKAVTMKEFLKRKSDVVNINLDFNLDTDIESYKQELRPNER